MKLSRRTFLHLVAGAAALPAVPHIARAQSYPSHPVRIVVPYAPGGSTDTVARITADKLSRIWGQQVVIENKLGGGTNIAAAAVAGSDPDGYTMFIGSSSLVTSRLLYRSLPYAVGDLAPVTLVCTFPLLLLNDARAVSGRCSRAHGYDRGTDRSADRRQRDDRADQERPSSRTCGDHREAE